MSIPSSFSGAPREDLNHHFRNVLIEFKKNLNSTKDIPRLEEEIDRFINVCKEMKWDHKPSDTYRKDSSEKAVNKVLTEFKRYKNALELNSKESNLDSLLNAITEIEHLIRDTRVK